MKQFKSQKTGEHIMNDKFILFDTDMKHPLNQLDLKSQKNMIVITMSQFREIPLCSGGYNEEQLRFYDGVLGGLIRTRDTMTELQNIDLTDDFSSHWEYHGEIYRVIDKAFIYPKNGEVYRRMPAIKWHGMVASWSSSYDFTNGFNHIYPKAKYTIIRANTGKSAGIDVNKFSKYLGHFNQYTADENEIIFPMKKEFVTNIYKNITPIEFKELIERDSINK